jgi:DNA-binding winged helix-turn-helix (wHTH) protein
VSLAEFSQTYRIGPFTLDLDRRLLHRDGTPVALTRKNFEVLRELAIAEGRVVSRDELAGAVWPDTVVEEATLRQNVYTLRMLLREFDPGTEYLETIPKIGYRLVAPVEKVGTSDPAPPTSPPPAWRRPRIAVVALAFAVTLIVAAGVALARWPAGPSSEIRARSAELVRQGLLIVDDRNSERFPAAMALFGDALNLDSRSADAHAGRALVHSLSGQESLALADAARVQQLNPDYGVPFAVRGFFQSMYRWQWADAGRSFQAIEAHGCPDPFCRQWRALYLGLTGQNIAAQREAAGAVESFPARLAARALYGQILYWCGDNAAAIRELQTVVNAGGVTTHARWNLWKAQWLAGDRRAASENLLQMLEPSWYRLPQGDDFRRLIDRRDLYGSPEFFQRLFAIASRDNTNPYFVAEVAIVAGNLTEAADHLDRAVSTHMFFAPYARRDPLFAPLHGTPRYEAAMKKIGL